MTQSAGIFLLSLCEIPQGGGGGGGGGKRFFSPLPISFGTGDGYCTDLSHHLHFFERKKRESVILYTSSVSFIFSEKVLFYFFLEKYPSLQVSLKFQLLKKYVFQQFWSHQHQRVPNITFFVMFLSSYPNDTKKSVTPLDSFFPFWHQKVQSDSHPTDSRIK